MSIKATTLRPTVDPRMFLSLPKKPYNLVTKMLVFVQGILKGEVSLYR